MNPEVARSPVCSEGGSTSSEVEHGFLIDDDLDSDKGYNPDSSDESESDYTSDGSGGLDDDIWSLGLGSCRRYKKCITRGTRLQRSVIAASAIHLTNRDTAFRFGGGYICNLQHHTGTRTQCEVLKVFGLHFVGTLRVIVCPSSYGRCLIPATKMKRHLMRHHLQDLTPSQHLLAPPEWDSIVDHIIISHDIDAAQSSETLQQDLPLKISGCIPADETAENKATMAVFYQCAADGCLHWAMHASNEPRSDANIIRHYQNKQKHVNPQNHTALVPSSLKYHSAMVQKIQVLSSKGSFSHFFELPTGWSPTSPNTSSLPIPPSFTDIPNEPINEPNQGITSTSSLEDQIAARGCCWYGQARSRCSRERPK